MEGRKRLTIVFNSKSKSPAIPAALKIAMLYQHEIKEDGYCHVFFDKWDPDLEKLLDLVDGLKGTLLLDQEKRQFRSKYDYEISIKWDEEKKARERDKVRDQTQKKFQKDLRNIQKNIQEQKKDVESEKEAFQQARHEARVNLGEAILLGSLHRYLSLLPLLGIPAITWYQAMNICIALFLSFSLIFPFLGPSRYKAWKEATRNAGKAKLKWDNAQRELEKLVEKSTPEIPPAILVPDAIGELVQSGFRVRMEDVRVMLRMDHAVFDAMIVDLAIEYGFWIDGDDLVFDEGSLSPFMDRVKQVYVKQSLLGKIADAMADTARVPLKDIKELTRLEDALLDEKIIDWALQFGFKIDGDELVLDPQKTAGFINVLQTFSP